MAKGSNYERVVARELSLWISEGLRDDWVWRTSQSGGRATTRAKSGLRTSGGTGDLTFTDHQAAWFFKVFSIELKCGYKVADINSLIDSKQKRPMLLQFWHQCEKDRELSKAKWGLLIVKRDRKIPLVIIERKCFKELVLLFGMICGPVIRYCGDELLVIIQSDDFFDWIDPQTLKEIL